MPVNYDDVVKKNKKNLTRAQIKALAKAAKRYEAMNAGNRADAAASARAQYDAGYRGLQNMGLAGGLEAQATSGEVPRLKAEIQTPFDQYNQRLRDVEHKQMAALGTAFAQQTKRRRRAEAEARAKAEAEAAEARARAEAEAREAQQLSASMKQTATESRGMSGSTITSDIKRQRNVNMTDSGTGGQGYTNKMDQVAARDMQVKLQAAAQLIGGTAMGIATSIATGTVKSALGLRTPTMQDIQNAENAAAARVLGMSVPATPYESMQQSVARGNMRAAEAQDSGYDNGDLTGRVKGPTVKTQDQLDARANLRQAEDALRSINRQVRDGYDAEADRQAYEAAQKEFEQAEKAFNAERGRGAGSTIGAGNKRQRSLDMTDSGSDLTQTIDSSVSKATAQAYRLAKARRDAAQLKAEQPKLYASYVVIENDDADPAAREEAAKEIMKSWGYDPDERTDEQFKTDRTTVAKYASYLATLDDQNATPEERNAAEVQLKALGVTPDQARKFISDHRQARIANGEYNYYKNALMNQLTYAGKAPTRPVNQDELDPLYRAVNNLTTREEDTVNANFAEGSPEPDATTSEEYVGNELRYLTDDERNAYNYIYETRGLAAANEYIRDGLPLRNIRAAAEDKAYAEQLVKDSPIAANLLSIGANTFGNVPAMLEKIVKGTYNYMTGSNNELFIDTNNATHRLADIGNLIQSETSRRILGDSPNPTKSAKVWNFVYQTGMSMAQSAVAMTIASAGPSWITDAMFFSSAGNEAYKDAMERGATQEQALAYSFLNGAAEAVFEHASIEHFLKLDYQGKGRLLRNMVSQAFVEADEEVNTEVANILSDALVMKDKSQYNLAIQDYMRKGMTKEEAQKQALLDQVKDVSLAGLGGLASGLGFGAFGAIPNAISQTRRGREVKTKHAVDGYVRMANLLGGDAAQLAAEVSDSYGVKKSKNGNIETTEKGNIKTQEPGNRLVGALAQQVDKQMKELADTPDKGAAVERLLEGEQISTNAAEAILNTLGADTLQEMGYDTASPSALAKSYNARLQEYNVQPSITNIGRSVIQSGILDRMGEGGTVPYSTEAIGKRYNDAAQEYTQSAMNNAGRQAIQSGIDRRYDRVSFSGSALEQRNVRAAENKVNFAKASAASRVWANPTQGLATATADGNMVTPMPGNMTAVALAEQERTGFKARSTATKGNVTYAVAGMEARAGLSNEQTYSEIQNGLTKEARRKAAVYEKLADALGIKMTIHDVMTGTNGFIDEDGNMHVVLSGKHSVLRVAAHELTHWMKGNNIGGYRAMRNHLIAEIGQERFDRMVKTKAREYGIDLSTEKGKVVADDEVCAELCERMLSNEEALERFAEKDTAAAKTLKDHLLKILNAIKSALRRAENRDFGESWSDLIKEQETIESWVTSLQQAIENANNRAQTTEGQIAQTAGVTAVDQQQMEDDMRRDLFLDEEGTARMERSGEAEANATKGTKVPGVHKQEMEKILSAAMYGSKQNYTADDYKRARSMLAQLVPDVISGLNGELDSDEMQKRMETAVNAMLDTYYEEEGDNAELRDIFPDVIGVNASAKGDLKAQDTSLFQMSSKLSRALGKRVTLIGSTNANYKSAMKLDELWAAANEKFNLSDYQDFSNDTERLLDFVQSRVTRRSFDSLASAQRADIVADRVSALVAAVDEMLAERADAVIAEHSVDVIEYDMAGYRQDLVASGVMSGAEIDELFSTMNAAVNMVKAHRAILDFGAELSTEEDILKAKRERAYLPYKQNADPHYKLALDFSTLCRKRVLLQSIQERLQAKLGRALSQEETVAIRLELQNLQRNNAEEFGKIEVACALCYVEAARLKSPKVINTFLNNTANEMRNHFAKKNPASKKIIEGLQQQWKVEHGLAPDATKDDMKAAGVNVTEYNNYSRDLREQFESDNAAEKVTIDRAVALTNNERVMIGGIEFPGRETFLSASWLTKLKGVEPDIFNAFTEKVRSATRSKAQETDTFYSRGDIDMVTEGILRYANAESGFRHQSWSDFVPTHLLDTMASVIEMSTRKAKMHAYTKVPSMVRLLGKSGMMLNMSLIPYGNTGIDANGNLSFDSVEGMPWETMMQLRDMFPETAGNIAIGINDEQIRLLLASGDIDYVIPYHASGMNKSMRGYMDIRAWSEYTSSQNEKSNHRGKKDAAPELADWFDEKAAAKATDGEAFMRAASEKYLQECYKRNLIPKFSQYLTNNGDGSYSLKEGYENYWKMLTDRKMVNQKTGKIIIQQAVKPTFDQDTVMGILQDRVNDPAIQQQAKAADLVTEKFSGWQANRNNADAEAIQEAKNIRDRTAAITAQKTAEETGIRNSLDTDSIRQAFTTIDTSAIEDGLESLKDVKHVGSFALKDISRFLDASAKGNKELRDHLHDIFEKPHSEATGRYARGVERMQNRVMDIAKRAGVVNAKGKHFDSKKSAAIQNIGEGFSNTYTDLKLKVKDAEHVTVQAYDPDTGNLVVSEKDYTLKELRQAYGTNAADYVWDRAFNQAENAQATGGERGWIEEKVNTRPYTLADLQTAFPNDWQQLKAAADEFRQMYDEYIRDQNNMLATIYPIESEFDSEDKLQAAIEKKQDRLANHKAAVEEQLKSLQAKLEAKEKEIARTKTGRKRDASSNTARQMSEQAKNLRDRIESVKADLAEYEANVKEELVKMSTLKAELQNARQRGESDSLSRMHRLQYRSDYFHHFTEMVNGIQNLKAIFTNNTDQDIAPQIVGKSENTKAKTRWAGYFQQRMGGDYTADAINGMLRYGQLAEYKLAFDPLTAYLRDVTEQIRKLDTNATNRDGLIRYLMAWTDNIAGKSHKLDRVVSDAGMAPRKAMQILQWINSRVIQNTLLFNMRSALIQISNITNAKSIVKNNLDWLNGLRSWALAAKGDAAMASIMQQSNFLASRYMDNLSLTDSKLKSAKAFAGWMLGALDEVSAKATWWAAYQSYTRNPNVAKNQYRSYADAVDYADDVTRRTHAGRGVGELAPAMTSRVVNFVAPFQVEVNNTWQLLKDNVKQRNYLGLLSTGVSVFLFNAAFEAIVGSTPLGFDFIRAVMDIVLGYTNDDDDDDPTVTSIAQRLAGELVGGLPFAAQLVSILGEDNAKKLLGEDNDATRYGNTQIGVSAVMNAVKGLKDIGTGLIQGRRVNWIDDLDDLLNLTLPMGAKQLTRSAQGIATVAKGYAGKYDKEGNEKVQFVTDQDILHYIHAGLFGKWALREASEYFGEERLLPKLFGKYEGPKSATGQMIDAKEYKAALETGIDGKDYFSLKSDLKEYTTQAGKRAELMQKNLTPEQKAKLDALMVIGKNGEAKTEGSVVFQKNSDGEWKVKADYSNSDMFDLSASGDKIYTGTLDAMEKTGLPQDQAALAASMWEQAKTADDNKQAFRDLLRDNNNLTALQKEALDLQYTGNKYPADYSDPDLYELSTTNRSQYEKAKTAKKQGIPVKVYTGLSDKKSAYTGENQADYMRAEIMKMNLTAKQKETLDDLLVSDKGRNPDYSSPAWFEISMLGGGQYNEAKQGEKVGLKPETYLTVYKKYKTIDAKDENGKTRSGLKKKRCKEYLDSLSISAPVYDYIWTAMFGYKSR